MKDKVVIYRAGRTGEEMPQKLLWQAAFGDTPIYIDTFYGNLYQPERMALALCGEALVGMCALLPVQICLPDGARRNAAYLYALATDPAWRGRGVAHGLLDWAGEAMRAAGMDGVCTVPANLSLHTFFAAAGFQEGFTLWVDECSASPAPADRGVLRDIDAAQYGALRAQLLDGRMFVDYDRQYLAHLQALLAMAGGGLYRVELHGSAAQHPAFGLCAAAYEEDGSVSVKELLCPPDRRAAVLALLARTLPAPRYRICAPDGGASPVPFGMIKWFGTPPALSGGYLAFALD